MTDDLLQKAALMLPLFKLFDKQIAFTVACCDKPNLPIIFASTAFYELTKYSKEEVLGSSCSLLQGPRTGRQQVVSCARSALAASAFNLFQLPVAPSCLHAVGSHSHLSGMPNQKCSRR